MNRHIAKGTMLNYYVHTPLSFVDLSILIEYNTKKCGNTGRYTHLY